MTSGSPDMPAPRGTATRGIAAALLAAGLLTLAACTPPPAGTGGAARTISVQASKTIHLRPDYVEVNFRAQREGLEVPPLKTQVDGVASRVMAALAGFGIAKDDFTSSGLEVQRRYEYERDRGQVFAGFTVSRSFDLKVRDIDRYEAIVDALTGAGVQDLGSAQVKLDDEQRPAREALAAAAAEAAAKAAALAQQLDVDLGDPLQVNEGGVELDPRLRHQPRMEMMSAAAKDDGAVGNLVPKDFPVTAHVQVVFSIDD